MNIAVIGTGYVGLVTGTIFAELGNDVICVDKIASKVEDLNRGKMPIYEPGLEELVVRNKREGRLSFTTDLKKAVEASDIIFICVNTPPSDNGETDLSYISSAAAEIGQMMNGYKIIVNKSTVPVGTGNMVSKIIKENCEDNHRFHVVSNPEFLREGSAVQDALNPDRIIIGTPNHEVGEKLQHLYESLDAKVLVTDVASAEIIKYASNAFLATKISFINAISDICDAAGADVEMVADGMGQDERIGRAFLHAGLGYGGSCFPKDVKSLLYTSAQLGNKFNLLEGVINVNQSRTKLFVEIIKKRYGGNLSGKTFAMLGLAFKPNTDDMREAKSLEIIDLLLKDGATVKAFDPVAMEVTKNLPSPPAIIYCSNSYEACKGADAMLLVTEWREFKLLNMDKVKTLLKEPIIFDGRNLYDPEKKEALGFEYYCIGRNRWPNS